jgi:hypothetical protein
MTAERNALFGILVVMHILAEGMGTWSMAFFEISEA